jgi:RNA ligase (TIGR02306 family)
MATWKVSAERIRLFPHPKADRLQLAKAGMFQLVVNTANGLSDGDMVIFAPKRSVLPPDLRGDYVNAQTGLSYLVGDDHDRVSSIRLRGELSEGATIRPEYVLQKLGIASLADLPLGTDLSERLGIQHYEYPIPPELVPYVTQQRADCPTRTHDVELLGIYRDELAPGELVYGTEKVHGRQVNVLIERDGTRHITTKGLGEKGLELYPGVDCLYTAATHNSNLLNILADTWPGHTVQAFAEVVPSQKGFAYGQTTPTLQVFRVLVDGSEQTILDVASRSEVLQRLWVPVLYLGPYDEATLRPFATGKETVSGETRHIREGVVITPALPRPSHEGWNLALKIINPDFKGGDDDPA